jgi:hypothetical protein
MKFFCPQFFFLPFGAVVVALASATAQSQAPMKSSGAGATGGQTQ